jgi:hypothetical protein
MFFLFFFKDLEKSISYFFSEYFIKIFDYKFFFKKKIIRFIKFFLFFFLQFDVDDFSEDNYVFRFPFLMTFRFYILNRFLLKKYADAIYNFFFVVCLCIKFSVFFFLRFVYICRFLK